MHLLYPSSPLRATRPDEQYQSEVDAVRSAGFEVSVFPFETFQEGQLRAVPPMPAGSTVLYRGWMMTKGEYERLALGIQTLGCKLATNPETYAASHHLPNWYPLLEDLTPETMVYPAECDLAAELRALGWDGYFIKDYVKSLKTSIGSRLTKPEDAERLASEMKQFRGLIEGGFCVRRIEEYVEESETRYFVINGQPFSSTREIPSIVTECASRLPSRFYSLDISQRTDGVLRVVEVGDGQVSDLVGWEPMQFADVLSKSFLCSVN